MTGGAGLGDLEKSARDDDLAASTTGRAGHGLRALLRAGATARVAGIEFANFDFLFATARGFFEGDLKIVAQVGAPLAARGIHSAAPAAEKLFKNSTAAPAAENLAKNLEGIVKSTTPAASTHSALEGGVAVTVVGRAFAGIAQDLVGLADFFEFRLSRVVVRVFVGMEFDRELAVGLLEVVLGDASFDAENLVVVALAAH